MYDFYENLKDYFNINYSHSQQQKLINFVWGMIDEQKRFCVNYLVQEGNNTQTPTLAFLIKHINRARQLQNYPTKNTNQRVEIEHKNIRMTDENTERKKGLYLAYCLLDSEAKKIEWTKQVLICLQPQSFLDRYWPGKSNEFLFAYAWKWLKIFLREEIFDLNKHVVVKRC